MRKLLSILGIVVGIVAIILSLTTFDMNVGYYEDNKQYGGDAYTGMQNASAQAANNVMALAKIVSYGFGSVLLIGGLTLIIYSTKSLIKEIKDTDDTSRIQKDNNFIAHTSNTNSSVDYSNDKLTKILTGNNSNNTVKKICPHCGNSIKSNICDMCGKENNLF